MIVAQHEFAGQTQRRHVPMRAFTKKEAELYALEVLRRECLGGAVKVIESYFIEPAAFAALSTTGVNA